MKLDWSRHGVYAFLLIALLVPLLAGYSVKPARMKAADTIYAEIEKLPIQDNKLVFVTFDYGPSLQAENGSQAEVILEHLFRRRIKVALFSIYFQAEPFLEEVPRRVIARLEKENPGERWVYGTDWVNLGYQPPPIFVVIQSLSKTDDFRERFKRDSRGNSLRTLPIFDKVRTLDDVPAVVQISGLVGVVDTYIAFLKRGSYKPKLIHGCTSISIPDAYIYLDSGQLVGLFEGIAGAAWYSHLLSEHYPSRAPDKSLVINTALGLAHVAIIFLIIIGNLGVVVSKLRRNP